MLSDHSARILPEDEFNRVLLDNVFPPDWKNPLPAGRYNLVVIGAGTAGLVAAAGAAGLGARVALVERHLLGGDCLNTGCVPSKALIRSARAAEEVRQAKHFGVRIPAGMEVDFPAVMERMRRLRSRISFHDSVKRFKDLGVDVYLGEARFLGHDSVQVGSTTFFFSKAVIATGARAVELPIEGLGETRYLTNETVFSLEERPDRLAVIGGGPLGAELAQAFHRLGSRVTIIEMSDHLLGAEDRDAAQVVQNRFFREGIGLLLNARPVRVARTDEGKVVVYEREGKEERLVVDEILLGVGRAPNVEGLDLEAAGVAYDNENGVIVNDRLQTTNPNIYAAGDVCLRHRFTHMADTSARMVVQNALFLGRRKLSALSIPWVTYTDPEVAHVGMDEREAGERGIEVDTFIRPLSEVDRAIIDGEEEGFVKIHVKRGTDRVLGAIVVARHAGEMIGEISLAIANGIGLKKVGQLIHPYPVQAEAIRQAADLYNRTRLTPFVRKVLSLWLRSSRTHTAVAASRTLRRAWSELSRNITRILRENRPGKGSD